jgi:hypothetical protein
MTATTLVTDRMMKKRTWMQRHFLALLQLDTLFGKLRGAVIIVHAIRELWKERQREAANQSECGTD